MSYCCSSLQRWFRKWRLDHAPKKTVQVVQKERVHKNFLEKGSQVRRIVVATKGSYLMIFWNRAAGTPQRAGQAEDRHARQTHGKEDNKAGRWPASFASRSGHLDDLSLMLKASPLISLYALLQPEVSKGPSIKEEARAFAARLEEIEIRWISASGGHSTF